MSILLKCMKNNLNFEWPVETIPHYSEESFRKYKETFKGGFPRALEKKNIKRLNSNLEFLQDIKWPTFWPHNIVIKLNC